MALQNPHWASQGQGSVESKRDYIDICKEVDAASWCSCTNLWSRVMLRSTRAWKLSNHKLWALTAFLEPYAAPWKTEKRSAITPVLSFMYFPSLATPLAQDLRDESKVRLSRIPSCLILSRVTKLSFPRMGVTVWYQLHSWSSAPSSRALLLSQCELN